MSDNNITVNRSGNSIRVADQHGNSISLSAEMARKLADDLTNSEPAANVTDTSGATVGAFPFKGGTVIAADGMTVSLSPQQAVQLAQQLRDQTDNMPRSAHVDSWIPTESGFFRTLSTTNRLLSRIAQELRLSNHIRLAQMSQDELTRLNKYEKEWMKRE